MQFMDSLPSSMMENEKNAVVSSSSSQQGGSNNSQGHHNLPTARITPTGAGLSNTGTAPTPEEPIITLSSDDSSTEQVESSASGEEVVPGDQSSASGLPAVAPVKEEEDCKPPLPPSDAEMQRCRDAVMQQLLMPPLFSSFEVNNILPYAGTNELASITGRPQRPQLLACIHNDAGVTLSFFTPKQEDLLGRPGFYLRDCLPRDKVLELESRGLLLPKHSKLFDSDTDRWRMRYEMIEGWRRGVEMALAVSANIIIYAEGLDLSLMKRKCGYKHRRAQYQYVESPRVTIGGRILRTEKIIMSTEPICEETKKTLSFARGSRPDNFRFSLTPGLQERRLLPFVEDEELRWLQNRGLRLEKIHHQGAAVRVMYVDHLLVRSPRVQQELRMELEISDGDYYPAGVPVPSAPVSEREGEQSDGELDVDDQMETEDCIFEASRL